MPTSKQPVNKVFKASASVVETNPPTSMTPQKKTMGASQDRISNLPDHIIQSILCMIPLRSAIRTSVLSRRWRYLWEYTLISAATLDFGEDFSTSQSPKDFVVNVRRYLRLHGGDRKLEKLRVLFCPYSQLLPDIDHWIVTAASKGVKELELDLSQGIISCVDGNYIDGRQPYALPQSLFHCKSLTHMSLSRCTLCSPTGFASFCALKAASLSHVNITDEMLASVLIDCPLLESLTLRNCQQLNVIRILGPQLRLRFLALVDCLSAYELEISAPKLQSFHYFGRLCDRNSFTVIPELVDAHISLITDDFPEPDYIDFLSHLSNVQILTLCSTTLMCLAASEGFEAGDFQIILPSLQELQLLMNSMTEEHLTCIYSFLEICPSPFLEKLFIQLPIDIQDTVDIRYMITAMQKPPDVAFNHLKVIKMSNFQGSKNEMKLVKFLLESAIDLESLVLVAPPIYDGFDKDNIGSIAQVKPKGRMSLKIIHGQITMLPKASPEARIVVVESREDDSNLNPTHIQYYYHSQYNYLSGTVCHLMDHAVFSEVSA